MVGRSQKFITASACRKRVLLCSAGFWQRHAALFCSLLLFLQQQRVSCHTILSEPLCSIRQFCVPCVVPTLSWSWCCQPQPRSEVSAVLVVLLLAVLMAVWCVVWLSSLVLAGLCMPSSGLPCTCQPPPSHRSCLTLLRVLLVVLMAVW